jgi:hypothetical protein
MFRAIDPSSGGTHLYKTVVSCNFLLPDDGSVRPEHLGVCVL